MKIFSDPAEFRPLAEEAIKKFGHTSEHNWDYYLNWGSDYEEYAYASFEDGTGILAFKTKTCAEIFSEPLAHDPDKSARLEEFFDAILADSRMHKIKIELHANTRKQLLQTLPPRFRAGHVNYSLTAPVYDLKLFDPALPGGCYKDLRNARNSFYKNHQVEVIDARGVDKKELHAVIDEWQKNRPPRDRAYPGTFRSFVDSGFAGTTSARAFRIDGRISGINGGWAIPNTDSYYAAIGIHDYSERDMGDIMYLEDLEFLKKAGYASVDFGGSWKSSINYKLKFGKPPMYSLYKSYIFSIAKVAVEIPAQRQELPEHITQGVGM
jgi:hypothetical protein